MKKTFNIILTALLLSPLAALHAADVLKSHILIILADDQRWNTPGCMGDTNILTPHIDRLTARASESNFLSVAML